MGNKLCKKKNDAPDSGAGGKKATQFDRIISRLHLRPTSWKSDPNLDGKQVNRVEVNPNSNESSESIGRTQALSKSSDWTDVSLEVPEEHIHLRNPKLTLIFNNNDDGTPTPPPRRYKKNLREKIEAVAKTGLQALQIRKTSDESKKQPEEPKKSEEPTNKPTEEPMVAVEEPMFVKRKINYGCPICDSDEKNHNRDHHHHHNNDNKQKDDKKEQNIESQIEVRTNDPQKEIKRRKNLSVISLPNYSELKLTLASVDEPEQPEHKSSTLSLSDRAKKLSTASTGKLDSYISRCRSIGSLIPQQLRRNSRCQKVAVDDYDSEDSFGGLEDWDLGIIEHYNPKDTSLPRPRKNQKGNKDKDVLSGIENQVIKEEDIEKVKPKPPVRRSESLVKKINKEASESAHRLTERPENDERLRESTKSVTPPPSPVTNGCKEEEYRLLPQNLPTEENGQVEHSSLMKILQKFSDDDSNKNVNNSISPIHEETFTKESNRNSSLTSNLVEFEKNVNTKSIEEFINAEKIDTDINHSRLNGTVVS